MDISTELAAGAQAIRNSNVSVALLRRYVYNPQINLLFSTLSVRSFHLWGMILHDNDSPRFQLQGALVTYGIG